MKKGDEVYIYRGHYAGKFGRAEQVWSEYVRVRIHNEFVGDGPKCVRFHHTKIQPTSVVDRLAQIGKKVCA